LPFYISAYTTLNELLAVVLYIIINSNLDPILFHPCDRRTDRTAMAKTRWKQ